MFGFEWLLLSDLELSDISTTQKFKSNKVTFRNVEGKQALCQFALYVLAQSLTSTGVSFSRRMSSRNPSPPAAPLPRRDAPARPTQAPPAGP